MVEEPVKSFRFHMHSVDKKVTKRQEGAYPFLRVLPPAEGAQFKYNSTYAYTLTWTPGHMTIVGDIGELTVVHYNAMPTLEAACNWLQSSDYDYLLSKTNVQREFQRGATIDDIWQTIAQEALPSIRAIDEECAAYEKEKPKWRKRDGMTKDEFEQELRYWKEDQPRIQYRFEEVERPTYLENRNLWRQCERDGWRVPEGFYWAFRAWTELKDGHYGLDSDPNLLMSAEGMAGLEDALRSRLDGLAEDEILGWVYRDLGFEDYSSIREYSHHAFFQIAAIQHGARMILDRLFSDERAAA
ncbi:hypothetical protein [Rhizobium sp. R339]|uniref:hypothetical protein n=1 Tax=Rhizobium sp. R339 TaxID=1764273 RepID=UPI0011326D0F|nr:hypothetical protein [Rhizobium sp. R339]